MQLKHKAPIVFIRLLDANGAPVFENNSEHDRHSLNRVLICSEEQFKLFSLPNFKTLHKFKLTAHEGARVRRIELGLFGSKTHENQSEHSLMCLSNLGDVSIFSLHDFKRKYQNHFLKKEDINGITSSLFTKFGEGFYLKSSSEYQRFTLSSKRTNFPECFIQLPEPGPVLVEETLESATVHEEANPESTFESGQPQAARESVTDDPPGELNTSNSTTTSHNQSSLSNTVESVVNTLWYVFLIDPFFSLAYSLHILFTAKQLKTKLEIMASLWATPMGPFPCLIVLDQFDFLTDFYPAAYLPNQLSFGLYLPYIFVVYIINLSLNYTFTTESWQPEFNVKLCPF